jgi:hypothetical protein
MDAAMTMTERADRDRELAKAVRDAAAALNVAALAAIAEGLSVRIDTPSSSAIPAPLLVHVTAICRMIPID